MTEFWRALCVELLDRYDLEWRARERIQDALAQPAPEEPTDEELDELYFDFDATEVMSWRAFARAVLARWGSQQPVPVPVSERLPRPEDCNEDGDCWRLDAYGWGWYNENI